MDEGVEWEWVDVDNNDMLVQTFEEVRSYTRRWGGKGIRILHYI